MHRQPALRVPGQAAPARRLWPTTALFGLWLFAALCLGACNSAPRTAAGGTAPARLALVIGNAGYENAAPLKNPGNDAADMCAALGRLGFTTLCHTDVPDRAAFRARVQDYVDKLAPGAVGVVYFAGHGVQAGGANYLIPTQAQPASVMADPRAVLYGLDELFTALARTRPSFQLVVLDACRTDLFGAPAGGRGVDARRSTLLRALQSAPGVGNGLQTIQEAPPSTMVLYATASKDAAYDGKGRNGPLTQQLLRHIGTRDVAVEDVLKLVIQGVHTDTARDYGRPQTPYIYGSFGGRFCFAGCPGDSRRAVPPAF